MKKIKLILLSIFFINYSVIALSKDAPASFADLAEKLMPSVVNISTTQTVVTSTNPFPFQFPPGSPFEDLFKDFGTPQERKASALIRETEQDPHLAHALKNPVNFAALSSLL